MKLLLRLVLFVALVHSLPADILSHTTARGRTLHLTYWKEAGGYIGGTMTWSPRTPNVANSQGTVSVMYRSSIGTYYPSNGVGYVAGVVNQTSGIGSSSFTHFGDPAWRTELRIVIGADPLLPGEPGAPGYWNDANNAYDSGWIEVPPDAAKPKKAKLAWRNTTDRTATLKAVGNNTGDLLHQEEVAPGAAVLRWVTIPNPADTEIDISATFYGVTKDGPVWSDAGPEVGTEVPLGSTPAEEDPGTPTPPAMTPQLPTPPGAAPGPSAPPPTPAQGPSVWTAPTAPTTTGTALDKQTFKEGVGKLETALGKVGGAGGIDLSPVVSRLDSIIKTEKDARDANPTPAAAEAGRTGAVNAAQAQLQALDTSNNGSGIAAPAPSGGSVFEFDIGSYHFNFRPDHSPQASALADWSKACLTWIALVLYAWFVWTEMNNSIYRFSTVPQAKGNTVAGSGGQATGFIAAGIITGIIFVAIPTLWAFSTTFSVSAWRTDAPAALSSTNSGVSAGLSLLYFFVPVNFMLNLMAHIFFFKKSAGVVSYGVYTGIRWVFP